MPGLSWPHLHCKFNLRKYRFPGTHAGDSDSVDLEWDLGICTFEHFPAILKNSKKQFCIFWGEPTGNKYWVGVEPRRDQSSVRTQLNFFSFMESFPTPLEFTSVYFRWFACSFFSICLVSQESQCHGLWLAVLVTGQGAESGRIRAGELTSLI